MKPLKFLYDNIYRIRFCIVNNILIPIEPSMISLTKQIFPDIKLEYYLKYVVFDKYKSSYDDTIKMFKILDTHVNEDINSKYIIR